MKQRFSALDVSASVVELKTRLVGLRLQNVYDINSKTYLFKFSRNETKELLLIESGIRMHTTQFSRDKSQMPSGFCMKLRKHLRTRRLVNLRQLGADRIMDMQFSEGEYAFHIIVEFYSSGNIILTDHEYRILSVLRTVEYEASTPAVNDANIADVQDSTSLDLYRIVVGHIYPIHIASTLSPITPEKLLHALKCVEIQPDIDLHTDMASLDLATMAIDDTSSKKKSGGKKKKQQKSTSKSTKKQATLKTVLRGKLSSEYGNAVLDHCIILSGLDPNLSLPDAGFESTDSSSFLALLNALKQGDDILSSCIDTPQQGYIVTSDSMVSQQLASSDTAQSSPTTTFTTYQEFHPYRFEQFNQDRSTSLSAELPKQTRFMEFVSFDKAVDEYFSKMESQRLEIRAHQAELAAVKKLENVKKSHQAQIQNFQSNVESNEQYAQAIESRLEDIDSVLRTVQSFLASGMDWKDLEDLVKEETNNGNALAKMIIGFKLNMGMITVGMYNNEGESSSDDDESDHDRDNSDHDNHSSNSDTEPKKTSAQRSKPEFFKIDLDIYSTAYANARRYYGAKKVAITKQSKTMEQSAKVVKMAEMKIFQHLASVQKTAVSITKIRKPYWFEKFLWFVSSENFLVVGGKDATQSNMLVTRYLKKGDAYVHSDLPGAASVIVKCMQSCVGTDGNVESNPTLMMAAIPPTTLLQAGTMSVCQSRAWDAKIITSAYWAEAHQVSKTTSTGDTLPLGTFMIRGKKNWLPPVQLIYGMAMLFQTDHSCIKRHYWERRPWGRDGIPTPAMDHSSSAISMTSNVEDAENSFDQDNGQVAECATVDDDELKTAELVIQDNAKIETQSLEKTADEIEFNLDADKPHRLDLQEQQETLASKYDFEDANNDDFADSQHNADTDQLGHTNSPLGKSKRHISSKERRLMKKSGMSKLGPSTDLGNNTGDSISAKAESGSDHDSLVSKSQQKRESLASFGSVSSSTPATLPSSTASPMPAVRGKMGKMKKLKSKYANQDEEDRELILDLLGSAKGPQPKGKKAKAQQAKKLEDEKRKERHDREGRSDKKQNDGVKLCMTPVDTTTINDQPASNPAYATKNQLANDALSSVDKAPYRNQLEQPAMEDDEQAIDMSFLDLLTGQPHETDNLLYAIPVCAPWTALQKYKYKVKLLPGALKRGKAAKSITASFLSMAAANESVAEKELIKAVPDADWISTVLGKVKVVVSAADQVQIKKHGNGSKRGNK
ncbi:hypothetical protein O5D80_004502 [Batrachochytrium dendrobatidis]|nr:hypothetical protein O5D80_004502 [Batrachochytrium dendrobatidis]